MRKKIVFIGTFVFYTFTKDFAMSFLFVCSHSDCINVCIFARGQDIAIIYSILYISSRKRERERERERERGIVRLEAEDRNSVNPVG